METNKCQEEVPSTSGNGIEATNGADTDPSLSSVPVIKSSYINAVDLEKKDNRNTDFSTAFNKIKESDLFEKVPSNLKVPDIKNPQNKVQSKNCVIVNSRQRGNPILKFIRNVPWEYGEIIPDYVMGLTTCAMFLSLRYHTLNPNYIHDRLKALGRQYELRVLLAQVDIKEPHLELKQLTKICIFADLTLMLAWTPEEAGRIIETYKVFENKPPDLIMEKQGLNIYSQMVDALTSIKSINRTDAMTLLSTFGSLEKIVAATEDQISMCPGFGPQKASKLHTVLHQSFKKQ